MTENCRNGHPRTEESTRYSRSGARECRICVAERRRKARVAPVNTDLDRAAAFSTLNVEDVDGCWIWQGVLDKRGYGRATGRLAHRWVYQRVIGPIPDGLELDHLCRVPSCVNPDHLEPVTTEENRRRRYAAMDACKNGHEYNQSNTRFAQGKRHCRVCQREYQRVAKERRKAREGSSA